MQRWNARTCKHTAQDIEEGEGTAEEEDCTDPTRKNVELALFFLKYAGMQNEEGGGSRGEKSPFIAVECNGCATSARVRRARVERSRMCAAAALRNGDICGAKSWS